MSNKIKLVVVNENRLGYIDPYLNNNLTRFNTLRALVSKGANFSSDDIYFITGSDTVRLAKEADFNEYGVVFDGYKNDPKYEYNHDDKRLYLLSDATDVFEARMMTADEAVNAQKKADEATDGNLTWYGPFMVKEPGRMDITWRG